MAAGGGAHVAIQTDTRPNGPFLATQKLGLLTEMCPLGHLTGWVKSDTEASLAVDWARRVRLSSHVARALEGLHAEGLVHRDVAAKNVLMRAVEGEDGVEALLADFGLARDLTVRWEGRGPRGGEEEADRHLLRRRRSRARARRWRATKRR